MKTKIVLWLAVPLLLAAALVVAVDRGMLPGGEQPIAAQPGKRGKAPPAKSVAVSPVRQTTVVDRLQVTGTVRAREAVTVTAETSGVVQEVLFEDGASVASGTPLLRLEDREEKAELAAARAALTSAERAYARASQLRRDATIAQSAYDQAAAAVEAARAAVAVAEARLAERTVSAPFAGRLGFRSVSPGAYLQPGDEITTLDDVSRVHVDFTVPETRLSEVAIGQTVHFAAPGGGPSVEAKVTSVSSRVDPVSRQGRVRATIDNPGERLRPGQLVVAEVAVSEHRGTVVPGSAVVSVGHQHFAFVVGEDDRAERREVLLGWRGDGRVEVVRGLRSGERLVIEGAAKLDDGDPLAAVPAVAVDEAVEPGS